MKKIMDLALLLLTGCSTLQVATSIPEDELKDSVFNYYDKILSSLAHHLETLLQDVAV